MLIDKGAQINSQTELGRTAVHLALGYHSKECLRLLIRYGCDVNLQVENPIIFYHKKERTDLSQNFYRNRI